MMRLTQRRQRKRGDDDDLDTLLNDPDTGGRVEPRSRIARPSHSRSETCGACSTSRAASPTSAATAKSPAKARYSAASTSSAASLRTGIGRRDKHLRSADFFDVDRFGEISVVVTAVHPTERQGRRSSGHLHHQRRHRTAAAVRDDHRARGRLDPDRRRNQGRSLPVRPGLEPARHDRRRRQRRRPKPSSCGRPVKPVRHQYASAPCPPRSRRPADPRLQRQRQHP